MNDNVPIRLTASGQPNNESEHDVEKTSEFLLKSLKGHPEPYLSIGTLLELLRRRSYGALLIMLSLAGLIPGISFFCRVCDFPIGVAACFGATSAAFAAPHSKAQIASPENHSLH